MDAQTPPLGFPGRDDGAGSPVLYTKLIGNQIVGYYKTTGTSFYEGGGSIRRFTLPSPLPSLSSNPSATFSARIADGSYGLNLSKVQGPQSLLLVEAVGNHPGTGQLSGLLFAGATGHNVPNPFDPTQKLGSIARKVSLILTNEVSPGELFPIPQVTSVAPVSHLTTDYQLRGASGRGPEGMAVLDQGNDRFVFVNNYHEGTVTIFHIKVSDPFNRGPRPLCELTIDAVGGQSLGSFPEPEGNLNRPLAIAQFTCPMQSPKKYLLVGLNFDPPPDECPLPPHLCTGADGFPDEGFFDYLVAVDVSNLAPTPASCQSLTPVPIVLGPSNQGTVASIAVHPDGDMAYVVSSDFPPPYQDDPQEEYLYAVDLCQLQTVKSIRLTGAFPGLGLPKNSAEKIVAFRNPNLVTKPERLYIGTNKAPTSGQFDDGHILVFDITASAKSCPAFRMDFDLTLLDTVNLLNPTSFRVTGLVAVPVAFLGQDTSRNVIIGVGTDFDITRKDRLILFEDR